MRKVRGFHFQFFFAASVLRQRGKKLIIFPTDTPGTVQTTCDISLQNCKQKKNLIFCCFFFIENKTVSNEREVKKEKRNSHLVRSASSPKEDFLNCGFWAIPENREFQKWKLSFFVKDIHC